MKKIKDLTVEEYEKWFTNNCCVKYNCLNCPFSKTICEPYKTNSCWIFNKNLYSNEFLNKEIELDNEILSNNERKFLQAYINLYNDFGKVKKIHIKENESSNDLSISIVIENGKIPYSRIILGVLPVLTKNTLFKNMKDKFYTIEELGLK